MVFQNVCMDFWNFSIVNYMNWLKENWIGVLIWGSIIGGGAWWFFSDFETTSRYDRTDDPPTTRSYESGDRDCTDFSSQSEAQRFFIANGGPSSDLHNLDRDGDGVACETLP